jgi:uncharacterized protein involved in cysteine biosynthesis
MDATKSVADWVVLRTQERVGIAKCYFLPACWGTALTLGVIGDLLYGRNVVVSVLLALWLLAAAYFDWQPAWKAEQQRADRIRMVVTTRFRDSRFFKFMLIAWAILFLLSFVPPIRILRIVEHATTTIAALLSIGNTFPMSGPTLSDRLRQLFALKTPDVCAVADQ